MLAPIVLAGKWLDFHCQRERQVKVKGYIESIYLHASYGSLLIEYSKRLAEVAKRAAGRTFSFAILAVVVFAVATCLVINYFLFRSLIPSPTLTKGYLHLLPILCLIGIVDFYLTSRVVALAARGGVRSALIISAIVLYLSVVLSESVISTFFIWIDQGFGFYVKFFSNRLWNVLISPVHGVWSVTSKHYGYSVSALAYAYPAAVVSSFFLVSASFIALISAKFMQGPLLYFVSRLVRADEKQVFAKLAIGIHAFLSLIVALIVFFFW